MWECGLSRGSKGSALLNLGFGEPMFCTLASRGFCHFRDFRESSNQPPCLWFSGVHTLLDAAHRLGPLPLPTLLCFGKCLSAGRNVMQSQ